MHEMKKRSTLVFLVMLLLLVTIHARHIGKLRPHHGHHQPQYTKKNSMVKLEFYRVSPNPLKHKRADTLQVAGSSLPDCTHACGSCTPCRLVMVSFVCSSIEEAETCPMAYKCMCHNKSYPVP
ncbi:epidermal patterning factor 1 [Perilla frutescens var. hirtella]|uniref:Epidermal patterning factor-like protein n=1 Tax=Perilla frutescens var. hirtella TaxID=608512 RepID=A0AAD4J0W8_PERFH|nr:epidermal patterning factor 1 [Perilla frutescens var. frutescens]KAH6775337.1 epidermal patterning factor 1 [Perilla frutescens var. hirtella]KAH6825155.1 epidermal patterning factor 1 [Perilla frutescens var. hirtella]